MILALSSDQAQELAKIFEVAQASGTFDGAWWMNNEALFPNHAEKNESQNKNRSESTADTKPSANNSPEQDCKKACHRNSSNHCRPNNNRCGTFQHCRRMNQAARRQRQANQKLNCFTRIIEQRTPIHMHKETADAAKMSLDVTGFSPSDISIHIDDCVVSISGRRTNKLGDVFVLDRRFRLDKKTASMDQVTANFEDGILEVTVPKKSVAGPRKIPIAVSGSVASTDSVTETKPIETESIEQDSEKEPPPQASQVSAESSLTADWADGVEEEESHETEETNPEDSHEQSQTAIEVETVQEDKVTIEEYNQSHATTDIPATNSGGDETWEEVSN